MRWSKACTLLTAIGLQVGAAPLSSPEASDLVRRDVSANLRIMPLGDSITRGSLSSQINGYRGPLQDLLSDVPFDFIGTMADGNMKDTAHEGHSGKVLSEISTFSLDSVGARPNVILLHGGTNDLDLDRDVSNAPDRLGDLIDQLLDHCSDAVVIAAKIISANPPDLQTKIESYNAAVEKIVKSKASAGKHVQLVDMQNILTLPSDLADDKHPNDGGYSKMADAWYKAILEADKKGWIKDPVKPEVKNGVGLNSGDGGQGECPGSNWIKNENAASVRIWQGKGQVFSGYDSASLENVIFADVTGMFLFSFVFGCIFTFILYRLLIPSFFHIRQWNRRLPHCQ